MSSNIQSKFLLDQRKTWLNNNDKSVFMNEFQFGSSHTRNVYKSGGKAIFGRKGIVYE